MKCEECGAPLPPGESCRDYLNQMIVWDFDDFTGVGQIHHLTVISYNLQHPSLYSRKGLEYAKTSLLEFSKNPTAYTKHGMHDLKTLSSDVRDWKITGTAADHGNYEEKPVWTMRASDVVAGGLGNYVENVKRWSSSIIEALEKSGNV